VPTIYFIYILVKIQQGIIIQSLPVPKELAVSDKNTLTFVHEYSGS